MTEGDLAAPATTEDVRDRVRDAVARRQPLRILGGGSWQSANRPVSAHTTLAVRHLAGIVDYVPGDLTLTARAGTTLAEIARVTAEHGQWLTLDPIGDPARATLGATIATASYGPLAHHFGTPRDMALGIEFVTGTGDVARAGGRVVKNVAGFDLTRLLTGSWGSLGVITEVSVRLRARPAVDETVAIDLEPEPAALELALAALRRCPFVPLTAELLGASAAESIGAGEKRTTLLVRIGGNEEAARAQRRQLGALGSPRDVSAGTWETLRAPEAERSIVVRLSRLPSRFVETWTDARRLVVEHGGYSHGDPGRGVVRCVLPIRGADELALVKQWIASPFSGTRVYERLPDALWPSVPSAARAPLADRLKRAFDPAGVLNPGILGATS